MTCAFCQTEARLQVTQGRAFLYLCDNCYITLPTQYVTDLIRESTMPEKLNVYTITIESRFILTQSQIKQALGTGYKVVSVETEKDVACRTSKEITVDSAAIEIIKTGYRALARAFHPDLGGDENIMKILNRTKTELIELIQNL